MSKAILEQARLVIEAERDALGQIAEQLDQRFVDAVQAILSCEGNVVVSGVGKSYFVAQKISASMASTGTPSISMHPVDALHGDLGRVREQDVVIALSNSGATPEILAFAKAVRTFGVTLVAMTGDATSPLADASDVVLDIGHWDEACPMGVAPSTTTTAMLALGDALTLTLLEQRGFTLASFAQFHPGGTLGRRLKPVEEAMTSLEHTACVAPEQPIHEVIRAITEKRCGAAYVVANKRLVGIFTDGDLRRLLAQGAVELSTAVSEHMSEKPRVAVAGTTVGDARALCRTHRIDEIPVVDTDRVLIGHLDIQQLA